VDQDSEAHQDAEAGTVDLLLKVKERQELHRLNGGVSGLSGAFLGVNYQTTLPGPGRKLSLQGNLGNVSRQFCSDSRSRTSRIAPSTSASSSLIRSRTSMRQGLPDVDRPFGKLVVAQQSLTQNYNQASQA